MTQVRSRFAALHHTLINSSLKFTGSLRIVPNSKYRRPYLITLTDPKDPLIFFDLDATSVGEIASHLAAQHFEDEKAEIVKQELSQIPDRKIDSLGNGVALIHHRVDVKEFSVQVLVRLKSPLVAGSGKSDAASFLWILISDRATHEHLDSAVEFSRLMAHQDFRSEAIGAADGQALLDAYHSHLDSEVHFAHHIPDELKATGKFMGGIKADLKRRLPHYVSDFTDGLTSKSIASTLFLFFACLAPAIAFGGLLSVMTDGSIGAIEMIVSTALAGVLYALFSAQPLTILGSTGPVIIFMGLLYSSCQRMDLPYLPTLSWVGLWTMVILVVLAVTDSCSWIRYFTRFTDETFAALISLIFIVEALKDIIGVFTGHTVAYATALLSLVLALGTYTVATNLSAFRRSPYLQRWVREFLADFGPAIAIVTMTGVAFWLNEVDLEVLAVPDTFTTTSGRAWLVNPFEAPKWVWVASFLPAVLVSILLYLDQNITVRLVNNPDYNLKKGAGYHLDLLIVGLLVGICSLLGLPWMVAATVRSLNHVRSLGNVETDEAGKERYVSVTETRMTGLMVHGLIAGSLLVLPWMKVVPMSVLFGLFLYMGIASMSGNQLFERLRLWFMEASRYPTNYYLRAVPTKTVHKYTAIQVACLSVLWVVKTSVLGILFPLFIGLLAPVRMRMEKHFPAEHLALLDAEEMPEEEEQRAAGP